MVRVTVGDEDGVQPVHTQGVELVHQTVPAFEGARVDHDPLPGGEGHEAGIPLSHGREQQIHLVRFHGALIQGGRVRCHLWLAAAGQQQEPYEQKDHKSLHGITTSKTFTTPSSTKKRTSTPA